MNKPVLSVDRWADRDLLIVRADWPDALLRCAVSLIEVEQFRGDLPRLVRHRMHNMACTGEAGSEERATSLDRADWTPVCDALLPPAE